MIGTARCPPCFGRLVRERRLSLGDEPMDSFQYFEGVLMTWLERARLWEIARVLELVAEELRRRA